MQTEMYCFGMSASQIASLRREATKNGFGDTADFVKWVCERDTYNAELAYYKAKLNRIQNILKETIND